MIYIYTMTDYDWIEVNAHLRQNIYHPFLCEAIIGRRSHSDSISCINLNNCTSSDQSLILKIHN